jgi:hypothetical protein
MNSHEWAAATRLIPHPSNTRNGARRRAALTRLPCLWKANPAILVPSAFGETGGEAQKPNRPRCYPDQQPGGTSKVGHAAAQLQVLAGNSFYGSRCKALSAMQTSWRASQTRSTATALVVAQGGKRNRSHARRTSSATAAHGCLTPRSTGAPTAGHQARAGGTRCIFTGPGLASCRWRPVTSNVRRRKHAPSDHEHHRPSRRTRNSARLYRRPRLRCCPSLVVSGSRLSLH